MYPSEEFLSRYPPEIHAITNKGRGVIMRAAPGAKELLYTHDNHFGCSFSARYSGRITYLVPRKDYVRLSFFWGGYLPDSEHLLAGEGKRLRRLELRRLEQCGSLAMRGPVHAACADAKANRIETLDP